MRQISYFSPNFNFKANISASSYVSEQSSSSELNGNLEAGGIKVSPFHMDAKVNAREVSLTNGKATMIVTYKNSQGIFEPNSITIDGGGKEEKEASYDE